MTDQSTTPNTELLEKLAAKEHERWASWQNYLHSFLSWNNELQAWVLPHEWKDRWQSQINTPYAMLSEKEKQSDRDQVMRYWPLIQAQLSETRKRYEAVCKTYDGMSMEKIRTALRKDFRRLYVKEFTTDYESQRLIRDTEIDFMAFESLVDAIESELAQAEIHGMQRAKSLVLRRTEIPKDAKDPTRDAVVILGEQIAEMIDDDIAQLNFQKPGEEEV